ncbi:hypothetical protein QQS21_000568 [Conoideocrella luteorostrata]|uniref:Rhodopsin domain-containing protein n=1 Tax=Conoideocrella luteorostrata TaxID=1105319 RepID=A0AAJ0CZP1_9HYPO|nr:hypothetical protein QQS21_000568 [Conoideocrella luteorostrata]
MVLGLDRSLLTLFLVFLLVEKVLSDSVSDTTMKDALLTMPSCARAHFQKLYVLSGNLTKTICQVPVRDRTVEFNVMILVLAPIAVTFVTVRLLYKQFFSVKQRFERDDWAIFLVIPIAIPCIVLTIVGLTGHGLGRDLWGLSQSDLEAFGLYFYLIEILYIVLMAHVKLALCLFYLNIFSGTGVRRLLWISVGFHVAFTTAFVLGIIFQCSPIRYQWEKYDWTNGPTAEGHCININVAGWANASITLASDIWLLAIPLWQIKKLKLHWKKKIGVALMFLTGAM